MRDIGITGINGTPAVPAGRGPQAESAAAAHTVVGSSARSADLSGLQLEFLLSVTGGEEQG